MEYEKTDGGVRILRCDADRNILQIPEQIENVPVTELGAYACAKSGVRELYLPKSLRRIGRYAFYNCFSLERLSFYDAAELGAGAFTGCHKVRRLEVTAAGGARSCFKEVLLELSEELRVSYHGEGEARLAFPEYYEEGVENTPARILMTQVHGSGLYYRNCFRGQEFHFEEYDARFPMAQAQESEEFLLELVLGRLRCPYRLTAQAKERYQAYLTAHLYRAGLYLAKRRDEDGIRWLADAFLPKGEKGRALLDRWTAQEAVLRLPSAGAYLMELRRQKFPSQHTTFTL